MFLITTQAEKGRAFRLNTEMAALLTGLYCWVQRPDSSPGQLPIVLFSTWLIARIFLTPAYLWLSTLLGRGFAVLVARSGGRGIGVVSSLWCVEGTAFTLLTVSLVHTAFLS